MAQNKVKMVKVLNTITLESTNDTTQADADRVIVEAYESDKINICASYTTGAAETSNACDITVFGYDGTNWIPLGATTIAGGVATYTANTYRIAGAAGGTTYLAEFHLGDIIFTKYKVAALESGVASNKGTLTVVFLVG